jgi:hypothetical protein
MSARFGFVSIEIGGPNLKPGKGKDPRHRRQQFFGHAEWRFRAGGQLR